MKARLAGKRAVVTGAASGIGRAIALRFAEEGATVLAADRADLSDVVATATDDQVEAHHVDLAEPDEVEAMVATALQRLGGLDILINNAAIQPIGRSDVAPESQIDDAVAVNLRAPFIATRCAAKALAASKGSVIHLSSVTGLVGHQYMAAYSSTKAALLGLMRAQAADFAPVGVRVNAICPGNIRTPINDPVLAAVPDPDEMVAKWAAAHPLGRIGEPEEVASAAVFLASDEAAFITGHALVVDGGYSSIKQLP